MLKHITHNANKYGASVSSQDWLKFLAIITMTIDHIGWCFVPDSSPYYAWFRTIGRIHVPIWFFFAGYSVKNNAFDKQLLFCAIVLIAVNLLGGRAIAPLNVLCSIIIARYCVIWLNRKNMIPDRILDIFIICLLFSPFTQTLFEYGALGVLYAVMGNMVRRGFNVSTKHKMFFVASFALFTAYQYVGVQPNAIQAIIMIMGLGYYSWLLAHFEMRPLTWFESHATFSYVVRLFGRNTLYYYTIHRSIFVLASYYGGFYGGESFK
jgi:hypothetical protein